MIDKDTLDAVLPLPEIEERRDELVAELKEEGFVVTNFHSGGIFYTLLMIVLRIEREFKQFLRNFLNNAFVTHASGAWLDLKATDYSKKRKKAQKARGLVTVSRMDAEGDAVKIEKGHVFKTKKDINGEELRFFVLEATVLQQGPGRSTSSSRPRWRAPGTMSPRGRSPGASPSSTASTRSATARTG